MFSNIKKQIKELAIKAVQKAEVELGSGKGQEKKVMAINYILKNLPFSQFVKSILSVILSSFIDDVIELSVHYLQLLPEEEGE